MEEITIDGRVYVTVSRARAIIEKNSGVSCSARDVMNYALRGKISTLHFGRQNFYLLSDVEQIRKQPRRGRVAGVYQPAEKVTDSALRVRKHREQRRSAARLAESSGEYSARSAGE